MKKLFLFAGLILALGMSACSDKSEPGRVDQSSATEQKIEKEKPKPLPEGAVAK